ncbi:MAG: hypothetical protein QME58_14100 [Bacteroidota bacterium]|nr:hypothetical protein [Bacteroidota bacterium]
MSLNMNYKYLFNRLITILALSISSLFAQESSDEWISQGGFKFIKPTGWVYQQNESGILLGHDKISGAILIIPTDANGFEEVKQQMLTGLDEEGTSLLLSGKLTTLGENIYAGEYSGIYEYQNVKAYIIGTHPAYGNGVYILAFDSPENFNKELSKTAEAIAKGMNYTKTKTPDNFTFEKGTGGNDASGLMKYFAGTYYSFTGGGITSGGTERRFVICSNGQFYFTSESGYSGDAGTAGAWGTASQSGEAGTWSISGNKTSGKIIFAYSNGNTDVVNYQVCGDGCIYFNDIKYAYEKPAVCN